MPYSRRDQDGSLWSNRMRLPVEFDTGTFAALENDVNLGVFQVVVFAGITADLGEVDSSRIILLVRKSSTGDPAGTFHRRKSRQIDNDGFGCHVIKLAVCVDFDGSRALIALVSTW